MTITEDEVLKLLHKRLRNKTQKALAEELGVSAPYLGDVLAGKRQPGPSLLRSLRLKREFVYRKN